MTELPISPIPSRMGRPPLSKKSDTKPVLVRLTTDVCEAMDELAGPNRRAEFIREAIEREIKRRSKAKS